MRLPHPNTPKLCFLAENAEELLKLIGSELSDGEGDLIKFYFDKGLPPVTSIASLSAMFGFNEGFIWSVLHRTRRHYRRFEIPKGKATREIYAPKVGLKIIQRWLGHHLQSAYSTNENVYGFVPGRSHLQAAQRHVGSNWVVSLDIENFFPSVSRRHVRAALEQVGYQDEFSKEAIASLTCLGQGLTQGAPSSPVLSNIALSELDLVLSDYAESNSLTYTRYADDIVMSGTSGSPEAVLAFISAALVGQGWKIADHKTRVDQKRSRLKVHGFLVQGTNIRLTKGYRNRIRAYKHMIASGKVRDADFPKIRGHIEYSNQVDRFNDHLDTGGIHKCR